MLTRYRTGGEQTITVHHVQNMTVDAPAIVGNVTHSGSNCPERPCVVDPGARVPDCVVRAVNYAPQPTMPTADEPAHSPAPAQVQAQRNMKE